MEQLKKYLPLILLAIGILLVGTFFVVRNKKSTDEVKTDDESVLAEVPVEKRPLVSLIPASDGHYLKLRVEKIVIDADSFDYLLEYTTANGLLQGVPGIAKVENGKAFETELLLGTESSGKFRYDEGVEKGSMELKFRKNGKLVAKFKTDFHMQTASKDLTSPDGQFKYSLDKVAKGVFYVTMKSVGEPDSSFKALTVKDSYAVFSSDQFVKEPVVTPSKSTASPD
jgi:hypothetical protein